FRRSHAAAHVYPRRRAGADGTSAPGVGADCARPAHRHHQRTARAARRPHRRRRGGEHHGERRGAAQRAGQRDAAALSAAEEGPPMKKTLLPGLVLLACFASGCAPFTPPKSVDGSIMGELDKAATRKGDTRPAAVDEALLPPLRMEMPSAAGRPIEPRFDLSVHAAPAVQVFMSLVSGTRYSMLVHPEVS